MDDEATPPVTPAPKVRLSVKQPASLTPIKATSKKRTPQDLAREIVEAECAA